MFGSAESEHPRLTNGEIISEEFQPICDHNPPTLQTDRQTDRRTDRQMTCNHKTALCTKVHRAVKTRKMGLNTVLKQFGRCSAVMKNCVSPL